LLVLLCTFALFPLLGLLLKPVLTPLVTPDLYLGILFLCMLPSTVQSSIAFTAAARGNVPAAICSASASNLFGIFITPVLVGLLTSAQMSGGSPLESAMQIALQLLLPFIAGQVARRWIGAWVEKHKPLTRWSTRARFCWWCTPRSARRWARAVASGVVGHAGRADAD
jgi:sodium/bile acid cotransporter 7